MTRKELRIEYDRRLEEAMQQLQQASQRVFQLQGAIVALNDIEEIEKEEAKKEAQAVAVIDPLQPTSEEKT